MADAAAVAYGSVLLTPKFDNLTDSIEQQLTGAFGKATSTAKSAGESTGAGYSSGLASKVGVVSGIVSSIANKAFDVVANSLDSAISRVDTLNQFPKAMEQMGFSSSDAQAAIDKLSSGIEGLPTSLDSITSSTQKIALLTGDLSGATDTALALNDAFLYSGSSSEDASRGLQQYVQMLSKGKPDAQSWYTLLETMGPALNKVAEECGYTSTAVGGDLYTALQDGTLSFDAFNQKLIECDTAQDGFAAGAATASAGIQTSMSNAATAVTKNLANIINAINGEGAISGIFDGLKIAINGIGTVLTPIASTIGTVLAGAFTALGNVINTLTPVFSLLSPIIDSIGQKFATIGANLTPLAPLFEVLATVVGGALFAALSTVLTVFNGIAGYVEVLTSGIPTIADAFSNLGAIIPDVLSGVLSYIASVAVALLDYGINAGVNFVNGVVQWFSTLPETVSGYLSSAISAISGFVADIASKAVEAGSRFLSGIQSGFNSAVSFVAGIPSRILSALGNVGSLLFNAGASIINGLYNGIKNTIGKVYSFVSGIASKIASLKGPLSYDRVLLTPAGEAIIGGLLTGLENDIQDVYDFAGGIAGGIQDAVGTDIKTALALKADTFVKERASRVAETVVENQGTQNEANTLALNRNIRKMNDVISELGVAIAGMPSGTTINGLTYESGSEADLLVKQLTSALRMANR